jgi:uncharacterized protein DUF4160
VPTIFEKDGYRVVIYTRNEHGPPHVHVLRGDTVIAISIEGGVARFRPGAHRSRKPPERDVRRAEAIVAERIRDCVAAWNRYHGGAS